MGAVTIQQMADRVAGLMREKLGTRGPGLADALKRGGRRLPRRVRDAATRLAEAAHSSQNPKLLLQIDEGKVAEDFDLCVRHLGAIDLADRMKGRLLGFAGTVFVSLLVVAGLAVAFAYWRGLL